MPLYELLFACVFAFSKCTTVVFLVIRARGWLIYGVLFPLAVEMRWDWEFLNKGPELSDSDIGKRRVTKGFLQSNGMCRI